MAIDQLGAAVLAHVVEGMEPVAGADDDHGLPGEIGKDPVAD